MVFILLLKLVVSVVDIAWVDSTPVEDATTIRVPLPDRFEIKTFPPDFKVITDGDIFDSLIFKSLLKELISHNLLEDEVF